ncbi:MAG: hypothetical protein OEQ18_01645, partial [Gammaproteobacteria bacterium]|nr:hypothetical protein [Gammaproteobacteria bacterium]
MSYTGEEEICLSACPFCSLTLEFTYATILLRRSVMFCSTGGTPIALLDLYQTSLIPLILRLRK